MLRIFIGHDPRQPVSTQVLMHSLYARSSQPLAITPLRIENMPIKREGLTPFTYSRFLVPWLCNYEGWALFLDADMLCLGDIAELFLYKLPNHKGIKGDEAIPLSALTPELPTVMVVKNPQRYEWASLILFNCNACSMLTPEFVNNYGKLHTFGFLNEREIGELPREYNHLVGYSDPRPDAKLVHFTQGIPAFSETEDCEYAKEWREEAMHMTSTKPWRELMGNSVHAVHFADGTVWPRLRIGEKKLAELEAQAREGMMIA